MKKNFLLAVLVVVAGVMGFFWIRNNRGSENGQIAQATPSLAPTAQPTPNYPVTTGNFLVTEREICKEEGRPLVYFFGSSTCQFCVWEKPVAQKVFAKFRNEISYHESFDSDKDSDVFIKYSDINPGYVPFLILGCKYARVGAGVKLGSTDEESQKLEEEALSAIICKLTGGKPENVCASLEDKINEVK